MDHLISFSCTNMQPIENQPEDLVPSLQERVEMLSADERPQNVFQDSSMAVFLSTHEGKLIQANCALSELLGYDSPDELMAAVNQSGAALCRYALPAERLHLTSQPNRLWSWTRIKNQFRRKDGHIIDTNMYFRSFKDYPGQEVLIEGILEPHDYRNTLEELVCQRTQELLAARQEAEHANRVKSRFLADVSHEIRNPLHAVIGFIEILPAWVSEPEALKYIEALARSAKSLLMIVNEVLDYSKIEAGMIKAEYTSCNPRSLLEEICPIFAHEAQDKNLAFKLQVDPDLPEFLMLDEMRLWQILYNLIGNAVKFTVQGEIVVSARVEPSSRPDDSNLTLVFEVQDSGIGIVPENHARIFESFVQISGQSKYTRPGTGLGLAISKHLAEMMNGEIRLESLPGQGSTFSLYLYNVSPAPFAEPAEKTDGDFYAIEKPVLVVDDNETNLELARVHLEKLGFNVELCYSGVECLARVAQKEYAVVLMDCLMPEITGWETACRVREWESQSRRDRRMPIIAMTAASDGEAAEHYLAAGLDDYLSKPFTLSDLRTILEKWLGPSQP